MSPRLENVLIGCTIIVALSACYTWVVRPLHEDAVEKGCVQQITDKVDAFVIADDTKLRLYIELCSSGGWHVSTTDPFLPSGFQK